MSSKNHIAPTKPSKPHPDFPLFPHATGRWAKKIRGQFHYFGAWHDPDGALKKYLDQKDDLHAGRKPKEQVSAGVTVKDLCNRFLLVKQGLVESGELTQRSWDDYKAAGAICIDEFGKGRLVADLRPEDFTTLRTKLARKWSPTTLGNVIQRIRIIFKFGFDEELIDRPIRYGQNFKRPSRKTIRLERARKGPKLFTATEVRMLIDGALVVGKEGPELVRPGKPMRAMVLLAINAGLGNADCGHLPTSALNLEAGILDFPRPKTGVSRRAALWPETVQAIREAIEARPEPRDPENQGLAFITKYGLPWFKDKADQTLAKEFGKLLRALGINGRQGLGFYTLRHTFRTIADGTKDQPAVDHVMGHEVAHMSSHYREGISDDRLKAVSDHVRAWLFGGKDGGA
jgi:integrase